jgi:hypothetical protein
MCITMGLPHVRFQVLTAASMKMTAIWDVAPCSPLNWTDVSEARTASNIWVMLQAVRSSVTLVYFKKTTRCYIPDGCNHLNTPCVCSHLSVFLTKRRRRFIWKHIRHKMPQALPVLYYWKWVTLVWYSVIYCLFWYFVPPRPGGGGGRCCSSGVGGRGLFVWGTY